MKTENEQENIEINENEFMCIEMAVGPSNCPDDMDLEEFGNTGINTVYHEVRIYIRLRNISNNSVKTIVKTKPSGQLMNINMLHFNRKNFYHIYELAIKMPS